MPLLVSHAMFVQSHTAPSAVKSFIMRERVKLEHIHMDRHIAVSQHTDTDTEAPPCHLYVVFTLQSITQNTMTAGW